MPVADLGPGRLCALTRGSARQLPSEELGDPAVRGRVEDPAGGGMAGNRQPPAGCDPAPPAPTGGQGVTRGGLGHVRPTAPGGDVPVPRDSGETGPAPVQTRDPGNGTRTGRSPSPATGGGQAHPGGQRTAVADDPARHCLATPATGSLPGSDAFRCVSPTWAGTVARIVVASSLLFEVATTANF